MPQRTDKTKKLTVLIFMCVISLVGLAYLFVPSVPVTNTFTSALNLQLTNTSATTVSETHSTIFTTYFMTKSSSLVPCPHGISYDQYHITCPTDVIIVSCFLDTCWYYTTSYRIIATSTVNTTWIVSTISSLTSTSTFTSTTFSTASTILPPSALYQESKTATIVMIAFLAVGLCCLLLLMMNRRKSKQSEEPKSQDQETVPDDTKRTESSKKITMFCKECGASIHRDSKFCKECGNKLTE